MRALAGVALAVLVVAAGCAEETKKGAAVDRLNPEEADERNAERANLPEKDPPIKPETYFAAGQLAESQGAVDQAVKQYQKTLEMQPGHKGAMYRLAALYTGMKRYNDAISLWQRYVEATRQSAEALGDLGYCYELAGKSAEAEEAYRKGVAANPKSETCRINYGLMLARQEKETEATGQLSAVLRPAAVHFYLGRAREARGDRTGAVAEYEKAVAIDPGLSEAQVRLAVLKGARGK